MEALSTISLPTKDPAESLIAFGEEKLLHGHFAEGLDAFLKAEAMLGEADPSLYYREGLSFFEYGSEEGREQALLLACKKFKQAHRLDPTDVDILHAWGNTLTLLGERQEEHHYFVDAKDKFEKALGLTDPSADLLWDYAIIWSYIGDHSGEAVDYQKAIHSFENAIETSEKLPSDFWIDFGGTALSLASMVKDMRQIIKSVSCYKNAIAQDESNFEGWSGLAEALSILYEHSHDEDHFLQANDCFANGSKIAPQESDHWLEWAKFLLGSARRNHDLKRLRACLEKCHRAYACDNENPFTLATWAEALALLGQLTERLDLIYEAENKIAEAFELDEEDPDLWYSLGLCLCCFGAYFNDYDYYYQAIEKFQIGLSIDRSHDQLWHAIANTYAKVGSIEGNSELFIQAMKFYEKAIAASETSTRHIDYAKTLSKLGELTHEKKWLEQSIYHFEMALSMQKNAVYLHPEWLFCYAATLDMLGDFHDDEKYYTRAIEIFSHVLMVDPDFHHIHHRLAQAFFHLGELLNEIDYFYRSIHHLRLALRHDEDNDQMILDWGIALINIAQHSPLLTDVGQLMNDAEQKVTLAAKLGNPQAYYHLSCLYSLLAQTERSMHFLLKARQFDALPPIDDLLSDEWLENLRSTSEFQEFMTQNPRLHEER